MSLLVGCFQFRRLFVCLISHSKYHPPTPQPPSPFWSPSLRDPEGDEGWASARPLKMRLSWRRKRLTLPRASQDGRRSVFLTDHRRHSGQHNRDKPLDTCSGKNQAHPHLQTHTHILTLICTQAHTHTHSYTVYTHLHTGMDIVHTDTCASADGDAGSFAVAAVQVNSSIAIFSTLLKELNCIMKRKEKA